MDHNRLSNLLFLFSASIAVAGCPEDGGTTGTGSTGDDDDDGSTTNDPSSTVTTPTASASGSASTTATTTDDTTTDDTTPPTTTDETTTTDPSATTMATEPTTDATMGTTEATTGETEGSTTDMTTGEPLELCPGFGQIIADCLYKGDEMAADYFAMECEGAVEDTYAISDECGMAQVAVFECISGLECKEIPTVGMGSDCDDELSEGMEICAG